MMSRLRHLCFMLAAGVVLATCAAPSPKQAADRPAHHTDDGFRNPFAPPSTKNPFSYLRMRYFGDDPFSDQEKDAHKIRIATKLADLSGPSAAPRVTWLGHSSFLIQYLGINVLTDPILSDRASPFSFVGPSRLVAKPIKLADLPRIDYVIISHNHYDHLDEDTVEGLGNAPMYFVPLKVRAWFIDRGIKPDRVVEFDWWTQRKFRRVTVTATPSQHWSGRSPFDRSETLWAAWHVKLGKFSFWFGGDTGYNDRQFKAVGKRWNGVDLALIPIGAYAPRWFMKQSHVNPDEAIQIHTDIRAKLSIGMHWGTFQLSAEPIDEPKRLIDRAAKQGRIKAGEFITLAIGETRVLPKPAAPATAQRPH